MSVVNTVCFCFQLRWPVWSPGTCTGLWSPTGTNETSIWAPCACWWWQTAPIHVRKLYIKSVLRMDSAKHIYLLIKSFIGSTPLMLGTSLFMHIYLVDHFFSFTHTKPAGGLLSTGFVTFGASENHWPLWNTLQNQSSVCCILCVVHYLIFVSVLYCSHIRTCRIKKSLKQNLSRRSKKAVRHALI